MWMIDVSKFSDEELYELKESIDQELSLRKVTNTLEKDDMFDIDPNPSTPDLGESITKAIGDFI